MFANASYAVFAMAKAAANEAESIGKDAWKNNDVVTLLNKAIREYLLSLNDDSDYSRQPPTA